MTVLITTLWPLFALIVAGYALRRRGFPSEAFWPGAERLNYFILFPALLFSSLAQAPLDNPALMHLATAVMAGLGVGWLLLLIGRRIWRWPAATFGVYAQGLLRFNTYLGLAVVGSLFGTPGLTVAALMLALMVPAVNILSVWALSADGQLGWRPLLLPMARNPLILACLLGVLVNLGGLGLPGGSADLFKLLGAASLPLGLLCVGAALQPAQLSRALPALCLSSASRLLLMPAIALAVAWALGLPALERAVLVVFFALPTAPTAYVLARQLGGDGALMAGIITLQTLLAAASLLLIMPLLL